MPKRSAKKRIDKTEIETKDTGVKSTKKNKGQKIETELNEAMSLVTHKDIIDPSLITHAGTRALMEYNAKRKEVDLTEVRKTSIDKHVENTRYKIAYVVDQLADELTREASKKTKRDKEYLKGITWSFGTLYDKLANVSSDAQVVALPQKLLQAVQVAITVQIERSQQAQGSSNTVTVNGEVQTEPKEGESTEATGEAKEKGESTPSVTPHIDIESSHNDAENVTQHE